MFLDEVEDFDSNPTQKSDNLNSTMQELWVVTDDKLNRKIEFTCKTLYKLQITQKESKEIERKYVLGYDVFWRYFGVDYSFCELADIKMFASMLLDTMFLEMPTMNIGRGKNNPDAIEEVHIKLKELNIVTHARHIVNIEDSKMPLTISLIGNEERYFGIKAVIYNRSKNKEDGVFFRVDTGMVYH